MPYDYAAFLDRACKGRLSSRPEFYSGRGVNRGDLGPDHLEQIHQALLAEQGEAAATAFVQFVESLTDLSATNFLNQFIGFYHGDCEFQGAPKRESGIDVGPDNGGRFAVGMGTLMSVLGRNSSPEADRYQSEVLKYEFFRKIGHSCQYPQADRAMRSSLRNFYMEGGW